jgi:copper transport protein
VLVLGLLAVGAWNRQRTLPALAREVRAGAPPGGPGVALRRTLRTEIALGIAALAATGALAGYSPSEVQATGPYSAFANLGPARAELTVEPALAGPNEIHLYLFDRADGSQWNATKELTGDASLPGRDIAPIELQPRKAGPGHYVIGGAPLAPAGDWTPEVVALVSDFDEFRTRFQVPIK